MRRLSAHDHDPGPSAALAAPVCPTTLPHPVRRQRGRPALAELTSTGDFTNRPSPTNPAGKLSEPDCQVLLFCLVCLVDEAGTLTTTYRNLIGAHGADPGHWCRGMDLDALRRNVSKVLGRGADRIPKWCQVTDLLTAALPAADVPKLLPQAAALYCRATGDERPPGYAGPIVVPDWAGASVVPTEVIQAAVAEQRATLGPVADVVPLTPAAFSPDTGTERRHAPREHDTTDLRLLVQTQARAWRTRETYIDQLLTRIHDLEAANLGLEKANSQIRQEYRELKRRAAKALANQGVAVVEIRKILRGTGQEEAALPRLPRHRHGGWSMPAPAIAAAAPPPA